jgi:hypothetical protein
MNLVGSWVRHGHGKLASSDEAEDGLIPEEGRPLYQDQGILAVQALELLVSMLLLCLAREQLA